MKKDTVWKILAVAAVFAGGLSVMPARFSSRPVLFSVPMGEGASAIARNLKAAGLIRSTTLFKAAVVLTGSRTGLKAGEYEIPASSNLWQVLFTLRSGKCLLHEFTVPPGFDALQIAGLLGQQKLANPAKFLALVRDRAFAHSLSVQASSLEGYLFPDTYQIPRGFGSDRILRLMVDRFRQKVPDSLLEKGKAHGLSPYQVLILASLVEREARLDSERPKVASVFLNRLKKRMRLESCATVRYAMDKYTGPVTDKDLFFRSPYNTYRHRGLPPGPICSPGLKSIQAAVSPDKTPYLFFVVAGDGRQIFSQTFAEHVKAKLRYKAKLRAGIVQE